MSKKIATLLFFLALALTINLAYAQDEDVNIENLSQLLADAWGTSTFVAGMFISMIVLFTFLFPIIILSKGRNVLLTLLVGFGAMGFCVAVEWLPTWTFLLISLMVAALWASMFRKQL